MKKVAWLLAIALVFTMFAPAVAAPLFPDVPAEHWARDAVANLAAKGILEGYPDGTFKGDRAATRWEMAMCVARLLAKMEQENATFATKADLEELQKLVNSLKDELAALGVRVGNLEDSVGKLDKRVTDLERIRFYGSLDTIFVSNGFKMDANGWDGTGGQYEPGSWACNGSSINLLSGRRYMVGSGFTVEGILGVRAVVSDDISAGLELAGFASSGDDWANSIYGISAPYLSNFYTQRTRVSLSENTMNTPFTRINLDNFWLKHNPSGLKVTIGSFDSMMADVMYSSPINPNVNGPKFLGSYGFQVTGNTKLFSPMDYEILYSYLPDGNLPEANFDNDLQRNVYDSNAMGFNLKWNFDKGMVKIGFLRAINERNNSEICDQEFQIQDQDGLFTPIMHWVNPREYTTEGGLTDLQKAPVYSDYNTPAGMNWATDSTLGSENFKTGPQGLTNMGLSANYNFEPIRAKLDLASTTYRPNTNSDYKKSGSAMKFGLGATLVGGALDLDLEYLSVSPYYNPMIFQYPYATNNSMLQSTISYSQAAYMRLPNFSYFPSLWQLHDSDVYPNNREGIRFDAVYKFAGEDGKVGIEYDALGQVDPSSPDIRYGTGSSGVVGFSPGFIEPFFHEVAGNGGEGAAYLPLEDNKGKQNHFGINVGFNFKGAGLKADLNYHNYNFTRDSDLNIATYGEEVYQNYIDLKLNTGHLGLAYPFNERFCLKGGYDYATIKGHHAMLAQQFAGSGGWMPESSSPDVKGDNLNLVQSCPYLGFDYKLSKSTTWGLNLNFMSMSDKVGAGVGDYRYRDGGPVPDAFKWSGTQLFTEVKVAF